jgi:tRNA acetyltransferase TAN1
VFNITTTEEFDLIVMFNESANEDLNGELQGIQEIEDTLKNSDIKPYIKESEFNNVVLVEIGDNFIEATKKLKNTPTKTISRVIPIIRVINTDFNDIINKIKELSIEKTQPGDTFSVSCDVMNYNNLRESTVTEAVKDELIKLNLVFDENDPKWNVDIGVIGENTGLSLLKSVDVS